MGNGGGDGTEGAWSGRVVGSYLHGPVLARNTALADLLLGLGAGPFRRRRRIRWSPWNRSDDHEELALRSERLEAVDGTRSGWWGTVRRITGYGTDRHARRYRPG